MNRAQALSDARQLGASLLARVEPPLSVAPIPSPSLPSFALPPNEAGERVCQAMTLLVPPGVDIFALLADQWQRDGMQPHSWSSPEGPILVGVHPAGFVLVLRRYAGQHELYVVSPILSVSFPLLFGGIGVGAVLGLVGSCFSTGYFSVWFGRHAAFLGFVPVMLLLGAGLLLPPNTRSFAVGLLIGGAITSIATAGICAAMIGSYQV